MPGKKPGYQENLDKLDLIITKSPRARARRIISYRPISNMKV
jgi:hypothetical protein